MADPDATHPTLKSIKAQLLSKELTIPKPASKGKGEGRGDRNKNQNRDSSKNANGTMRDKCTYEPCGKWGHKEADCFMKDPSKRD